MGGDPSMRTNESGTASARRGRDGLVQAAAGQFRRQVGMDQSKLDETLRST